MLNDTYLYNILSSFHAVSAHLQSMVIVSLLSFAPYCHFHDLKMKHRIFFGDKWHIKIFCHRQLGLRPHKVESSLYLLGVVLCYLKCKMGKEALQDINRFVLLYVCLGVNDFPKCNNVEKQAPIVFFLRLCLWYKKTTHLRKQILRKMRIMGT